MLPLMGRRSEEEVTIFREKFQKWLYFREKCIFMRDLIKLYIFMIKTSAWAMYVLRLNETFVHKMYNL